MPINDPVAVKFANERIRPAADTIARGVASAKGILALWQAQNMGARITDTADVIADGSPADGRNPITGADAHRIIEALNAFVTAMDSAASDGDSHATNALVVAVNPTPRIGVEL